MYYDILIYIRVLTEKEIICNIKISTLLIFKFLSLYNDYTTVLVKWFYYILPNTTGFYYILSNTSVSYFSIFTFDC